MKIRLETEKDYKEVENLTREAFWNVYMPGCSEHLVAHKLRNDSCFVKDLDYCIEENGKIIANIMYAKGTLKQNNGNKKEILLFGPVSVLPKYQKKGYGEKLITFTIEKAKELGYEAIVITGNPEYYKKYGFESCSKYGLFHEALNKDNELPFFMIKILDSKKITSLEGIYSDPKCYNVSKEEIEEFDKTFPVKLKEKKEGQF